MLFQSTLPLRGATLDECPGYLPFPFQSTLPLRGATQTFLTLIRSITYFNPRSPYGERLWFHALDFGLFAISIHAPLTGSDFCETGARWLVAEFQSTLPLRGATGQRHKFSNPEKFQSTLPLRGATAGMPLKLWHYNISIHAPLTGSDLCNLCPNTSCNNFNPRSPYGERQNSSGCQSLRFLFQSTLPLRERPVSVSTPKRVKDFNPRSPYGERRLFLGLPMIRFLISIHAPLTGSDSADRSNKTSSRDFNPRSPYGERPGMARSAR